MITSPSPYPYIVDKLKEAESRGFRPEGSITEQELRNFERGSPSYIQHRPASEDEKKRLRLQAIRQEAEEIVNKNIKDEFMKGSLSRLNDSRRRMKNQLVIQSFGSVIDDSKPTTIFLE
jgi:hypothetical protein